MPRKIKRLPTHPADYTFGDLLWWHLFEFGTRPTVDPSDQTGERWNLGDFAQLVGDSPLQYLARWRIARAAELLRDTDDKVATIATRVGYESLPSFTRAFKRWQQTSPGAFRRASTS